MLSVILHRAGGRPGKRGAAQRGCLSPLCGWPGLGTSACATPTLSAGCIAVSLLASFHLKLLQRRLSEREKDDRCTDTDRGVQRPSLWSRHQASVGRVICQRSHSSARHCEAGLPWPCARPHQKEAWWGRADPSRDSAGVSGTEETVGLRGLFLQQGANSQGHLVLGRAFGGAEPTQQLPWPCRHKTYRLGRTPFSR